MRREIHSTYCGCKMKGAGHLRVSLVTASAAPTGPAAPVIRQTVFTRRAAGRQTVLTQTQALCRQSLKCELNESVTSRKTGINNWGFRQKSELGKSVSSTMNLTASSSLKTFLMRWMVTATKVIFRNYRIKRALFGRSANLGAVFSSIFTT